MRKVKAIATIIVTSLFLLNLNTALAQRGQGRQGVRMQDDPRMNQKCEQMIPDLTEEQENKISELRTSHMKNMLEDRNLLNENRAKLRTLQTQDNPDMDAIHSLIEEMGKIRTEMQKERASHHQEIRSMLSEEQKLYFDKHLMRQGRGTYSKGFRGHGMRGSGYRGCSRL
jgi:Spy/CpxP family protein refolding chaperone